jgi:phytoene/squalene synthetase
MKKLFDDVSIATSKLVTRAYSTSFSMGIYCLAPRLRNPVYSVYGFVRCADEIVDTFHAYNKAELLDEFERDTWRAIERGISINPVLNAFQAVYHQYKFPSDLVHAFLKSMRYDLDKTTYDAEGYNEYIYGSAEVVGLMCLRVFTEGDERLYKLLKPYARKLGAAFQKVNFLRDIQDDFEELGRVYFPGVDLRHMTEDDKVRIERDIEYDFREALVGLKLLPTTSRFGVYVAYMYYISLFSKIRALPSARIMMQRIRINNYRKIWLLFYSYFRHSLQLI